MTNEEAIAMLRPLLVTRRFMADAGVLSEIEWDEWVERGWGDDEGDKAEWEDYNAHVRETAVGDHVYDVALVEAYELAIRALGGDLA